MVKKAQKDLMNPEERLASRLLERHGIEPPFDLLDLVQKYAKVEFLTFPANADGVVIGPKARKRPKIFINSEISETRKQFTLAHELGHIIIPWHIGNIISHTESFSQENSNSDYRQLEAESNRFAAELLMPTKWIKSVHKRSSTFQLFFERILEDSKASRDAALIKIFKCLPSGFICAELDGDRRIIKRFRSHGTIENLPFTEEDEDLYIEEVSFSDANGENFFAGDKSLVVWHFKQKMKLPREKDTRSWRDIIHSILKETNLEQKLQSINAILASTFNSHKDESPEKIYYAINNRFSKEARIKRAIEHPSFNQYVIKRIKELKERVSSSSQL